MKTQDENKKTNGRPNVKVYFQRLMILMVAVMVSTTWVGCNTANGGDDPGNDGGRTLTTAEKEFVGYWGAYIPQTDGDIYYQFKEDGTFKELRYTYSIRNMLGERYPQIMLLTCGKWRESGGSIYMTNRVQSDWDTFGGTTAPGGGYKADGITPKNQSAWKKASDFVLKKVTIYPDGIPTITSERVFKPSEWEGVPDSKDKPVPVFHYSDRVPVGDIRNAFDYINPK